MTDERGGRYFRGARFFIAGDKVAAQSHILEARSLMGYMRDMHSLGGPPIQVKYATLQDGTRIKATMMNGQYQAEIISPVQQQHTESTSCTLHMDSGIADLISVAPLNPDRYANATLYVGEALKDNVFWGRISVPSGDGYTAIPVGAIGVQAVPSPPNTTGQEIECLQYVEPERPAGVSDEEWADEVAPGRGRLYEKKLRVAYSFSSYFSGKMRLYIQAVNSRHLFADDRPSPELSLTALSPPALEVPMYNADGTPDVGAESGNVRTLGIVNDSAVSTGIYTDSNNHFWYVRLVNRGSTMDAIVTMMQLSECGYVAAARAKDSDTPDERDRFEALALSTGTPRADVSFTIENFFAVPEFSGSLCYGWTFKWDGSEAHIVLQNRTTSVNFIAYHLRVDIRRDDAMTFPSSSPLTPLEQERARWNIAGQVVEGAAAWRSKTGMQNIWVPSFGSGNLREWAETPSETPCYGGAPVYCFYDREDVLQVLRYSGADHGAHTEQQYPPCYEAAYGWVSGVKSSFTAYLREYSEDIQGSFSCGSIAFSGRFSSANESRINYNIIPTGVVSEYSYTPNTLAQVGSPCADNSEAIVYRDTINAPLAPGEPGWTARRVHAVLDYDNDTGLVNTTRLISVVIPWGDCAAVYLSATGSEVHTGNRTKTASTGMVISEDAIRFNYSDGVPVYYPGAASYTWRNVDQLAAGTVTTYSTYSEDSLTAPSYKFVGFDGVARDTDQGEWTAHMMSPSLNNLVADASFSTFSSAGQADIIGTGFTTGGYLLDDRGPGISLMYNRAFIGFA